MNRHRIRQLLPLTVGLAFLGLYVATLAPGILPADSGEFQLRGWQLGVAHPPGFPLYTMLAHLMTRLPIGRVNPAWQINLLSAFTSSLTVWVVYLTIQQLARERSGRRGSFGGELAGLIGSAALGSSTTFWAQGTGANIRSLTALLTAVSFYCAVRWYLELGQAPASASGRAKTAVPPSDRWLQAGAVALSWGIVHHASLAFIALVIGLFVLVADRTFIRSPRRWIRPFLGGLTSLLPLAYLLWRGAVGAPGAPVDLFSWDGFWYHVLARGFRGDFFYFNSPQLLWGRLQVLIGVMRMQFSPWLLTGMGVGSMRLLWQPQRRPLALLLIGSFIWHSFITATYRAPQTVEYMLPAYVAAALLLGAGAIEAISWISASRSGAGWQELYRRLVGRLRSGQKGTSAPASSAPGRFDWQRQGQQLIGLLLLGGLAWGVIGQLVSRYPSFAARHRSTTTSDYAKGVLAAVPDGGLILADWHWYAPLLYVRAQQARAEVEVQLVYPEAEPYAASWERRIGEAQAAGRVVAATHINPDGYANLGGGEPIGYGQLQSGRIFAPDSRQQLPPSFQPLQLTLGSGSSAQLQWRGLALPETAVPQGEPFAITLAWQPTAPELAADRLTLFVQLLSPAGKLVAQQDLPVTPRREGLTLTRFELTPSLAAWPGSYQLVGGAYTDHNLLTETGAPFAPLATITVTPNQWPPVTAHPLSGRLAADPTRQLFGYDVDMSLPQPRFYLHWQLPGGYATEVHDGRSLTLPPLLGRTERPLTLTPPRRPTYYVPLGEGIVWTGPFWQPPTGQPSTGLRPGQQLWLTPRFHSRRPIEQDWVVSVRLIGYEADGVQWAWWDLQDSVPGMGGIPTLKWEAGTAVADPHLMTVPDAFQPGQQLGATLRLYHAFTHQPLPILDERQTVSGPWVVIGGGR